MDRSDVARILSQTLREEKATDKKLTALAESKVNRRADGKAPARANDVGEGVKDW